jgi:hypothetical protein
VIFELAGIGVVSTVGLMVRQLLQGQGGPRLMQSVCKMQQTLQLLSKLYSDEFQMCANFKQKRASLSESVKFEAFTVVILKIRLFGMIGLLTGK